MSADRLPAPERIVVVGSVFSSEATLRALIGAGAPVVGVAGLAPDHAPGVSGYRDLTAVAAEHGVASVAFHRVNGPEVEARLREWAPDLVFVVGLSQLVGPTLLALPSIGTVGFHPTRLPYGRGRAPVAWLILEQGPAAATFFLIDDGVDAGPIVCQEPFAVASDATAADLEREIIAAIERGLASWVPELLAGRAVATPQDASAATVFGRRAPADGCIDWRQPAEAVDRLVRASTRPHPGAYTYRGDDRVTVWSTALATDARHHGVPGRVLAVRDEDGALLVQAGDHPLWVLEHTEADPNATGSGPAPIPVGALLGYRAEDEVHRLRHLVADLEARLERLERAGEQQEASS